MQQLRTINNLSSRTAVVKWNRLDPATMSCSPSEQMMKQWFINKCFIYDEAVIYKQMFYFYNKNTKYSTGCNIKNTSTRKKRALQQKDNYTSWTLPAIYSVV